MSGWLKFSGPLIVISLLLFGLGVVAAWNVQRQQVQTSELMAREVRSMVVEQDVYMDMREVRYLINQYLRTRDMSVIRSIPALCEHTRKLLSSAGRLATLADERAAVGTIVEGFERFDAQYRLVVAGGIQAEELPLLERLADSTLTEEVLLPAREVMRLNRSAVDRANEANRRTTDVMRQGFLLLGLTGGAGGLMAGLTLARSVQRSILQLHVSVSGAAGKLEEVVGPVPISSAGGLVELRQGLRDLEGQISKVVEQLRQRELEVLRNEQLAAVGQLAAGMAHELRNPLTPMKMFVQSALERGNDAALRGRQLTVLAEEISRLEASIQMFLDFARPPKLEVAPVGLVAMTRQTVALVENRGRRQGVEILSELPSQECWLSGDATQLRQVELNLLLNALDELPHGGTIHVSLFPEASHDTLRLAIRDTGRGFTADALARVFEPFATDKETGTGLGLTICRRIVEAHGGEIRAANAPAGGALFTIRLPMGDRPSLDPVGENHR
jgi:signal transduction histidine kinase